MEQASQPSPGLPAHPYSRQPARRQCATYKLPDIVVDKIIKFLDSRILPVNGRVIARGVKLHEEVVYLRKLLDIDLVQLLWPDAPIEEHPRPRTLSKARRPDIPGAVANWLWGLRFIGGISKRRRAPTFLHP
jgi:hypothetical protein